MKKIILPLYFISFSFFAHAQKDSINNISSDALKKEMADTIKIGNMIIVKDFNKTGKYEMGRGLIKIDLNNNHKGYRKTMQTRKWENSTNKNISLYVNANKDTLFSVNEDTVRVGRYNIIKSQNGGVKKDWESIIEDGDFDNTHIKIERRPKKLNNISTNWWIFDLGFANLVDRTDNTSLALYNSLPMVNSTNLKLKNTKSTNVNIWVVQQKVNLYQHYLNLKYGLGIEMYNFRFEQPISFSNNPGNYISIDDAHFSKNKLFVEYLTVPIQLNFQSNPQNSKSFYASLGVSTGYLLQSHSKQISKERGKQKVNGNFNLSNYKMATIGELGIGSIRLYGSYSMTNLFDKNLTNFDMAPFVVGLRFSKF